MFDRAYVASHMTTISIAIFVILFIAINYYKPGALYNSDGSLREFGLGRKRATVVPLWMAVLLIAVFSYLGVRYCVSSK